MIDQKPTPPQSLPIDGLAQMADSTITMSSSFTHLSMDTDEFSMSGEERTANNNTSNDSTLSYSFALYDALADICQNNVKYFECDESETGQRFLCAFRGIIDHITIARQFVAKIITFVHEYDFDKHTPANGYRSFVKAIQACINHTVKVCKYIAQNRSYLLFRKNMYMKWVIKCLSICSACSDWLHTFVWIIYEAHLILSISIADAHVLRWEKSCWFSVFCPIFFFCFVSHREIEACSHLLASLCSCLEQIMILREGSEPGSLFPAGDHKAIGLFNTSACVNQYSFYGRCIGFHVSQTTFVLNKQYTIMTLCLFYVFFAVFFLSPFFVRSIVSQCSQ